MVPATGAGGIGVTLYPFAGFLQGASGFAGLAGPVPETPEPRGWDMPPFLKHAIMFQKHFCATSGNGRGPAPCARPPRLRNGRKARQRRHWNGICRQMKNFTLRGAKHLRKVEMAFHFWAASLAIPFLFCPCHVPWRLALLERHLHIRP
jgi:hypothetical protein